MSYAQVIILGNLGADPELRHLPSGTPTCRLRMASNEVWNDSEGQKQQRTTWWRVNLWGRDAENAHKYLKSGRQVLVVGRMEPDPETGGPRVYERNDGTSGASYEVRAWTIRYGQRTTDQFVDADEKDEDIPWDDED